MSILIAEDDATSRLILAAILTKWDFAVETVERGDEALARLQMPAAPKLAILDRKMPGMEGAEICRRLRAAQDNEAPCYLILLTSQDDAASVVEGLEAGANDYIVKPYNPDELRARVQVGQRMVQLQETLQQRVMDLQAAAAHIKVLQGILPICMYCHKIRDDQQSWQRIEAYITRHSEAEFSHSICPDCLAKHFPQYAAGEKQL